MQQHLKISGMVGLLIFLGLTSRDLNMHLPQLSLSQPAQATSHPVMLAQNHLKLTMSRQMHH